MDGTLYQLNFQHRYTSGVDSPQPSVFPPPPFGSTISVTILEINITTVIRREISKRIVIMKLNII